MTLTEFLLARIAEDEASFEAAVATEVETLRLDGMRNIAAEEVRDYWLRPPGSTGDAVQDATTEWRRWLAECEAKRRIVETYAAHDAEPMSSDQGFRNCGDSCVYGAMDWTLKMLALPYVDHPDYDESWRP